MTNTVSWNDVVEHHGSRAAVRLVNGRVRSILCGGIDHADDVSDDRVEYIIPNRPYYKRTLDAFRSCRETGSRFEVYYKIRTNEWREMGYFVAVAIEDRGSEYCINLAKSADQSIELT